ncbi:MAG TPA: sugar ABC transporter substrate-binding protein [Lichenihabitans sp.]|jgi:fructose transport system substrate-binding protein|nr:sugar ABC transporter substrate-binding protein [Lichenihabitans sp.]
MIKKALLAGTILAMTTLPSLAAGDIIGLITKTNTNPFFVKMREGAEAKAKELGVTLQAYAGKIDGDNDGQVQAIEELIAAGAKGFMLVPSDSTAIVPSVKKARDAGLLVIDLDTPLDPIDAADATFATDNFKAGKLIGEWAKATLGEEGVKTAKIATLDVAANQPTVDYLRHNGFLTGFGIPVKNPKHFSPSDDPRIVGSDVTAGSEEGGRKAMENILQKGDVNLVYAINEPAAAGGYEALKAAGKEKGVLIVAIDGGCPGVKNVAAGILGATSQQYPLLMASKGVEAIAEFVKTGKKPAKTPGLDFTDTGATLITDKPVPGVPSITSAEGLKLCWG